QEILYGALSIIAITVFPEGVVGLMKRQFALRLKLPAAGAHLPEAAEMARAEAGPPQAASTQSPGEEAIVECRGIEVGYSEGPRVLRSVDLVVKRGHIHGLIGPNGSGKSTLANIIAGRLKPQAGTIRVKGVAVDGLPASQRAGLGLRRTFQA